MPTITKPEEAERYAEIQSALEAMEADASMKTVSSYSSNTLSYADNQIPFVQKHIQYLKNHPKVNPDQYLSNLRLMIRIR